MTGGWVRNRSLTGISLCDQTVSSPALETQPSSSVSPVYVLPRTRDLCAVQCLSDREARIAMRSEPPRLPVRPLPPRRVVLRKPCAIFTPLIYEQSAERDLPAYSLRSYGESNPGYLRDKEAVYH